VRPQAVLKNWIDRGELPAYHVGRRVRVSRRDFDAFIEAGYQRGPFRTGPSTSDVWGGAVPAPETPDDDAPGDPLDERR
jgi:hypothetical protein